jgi:hypothetical protein
MTEGEWNNVWENRLRHMAKRQGLELTKTRRMDPHAIDYGQILLIDARSREPVAGPFDAKALDEIERWLTRDP